MPTAHYFLSTRPNKHNLHAVNIRIRHREDRKDFPLGIRIKKKDFEKITSSSRTRLNESLTDYKRNMHEQLAKAEKIIFELGKRFSFNQFELIFYDRSSNKDDLNDLFLERVERLRSEERVGTADSYDCARSSFLSFEGKTSIYDITPEWLRKYRRWMLSNGKSDTTVGIYTRCLRTIYNEAIAKGVEKIENYPFGRSKFEIPNVSKRKIALEFEELNRLWKYEPESDKESIAKDFFFISFYSNGANINDILQLKQSNFLQDEIHFSREKTSGRSSKTVKVPLTEMLIKLISKHKTPKLGIENPFVFNVLNEKDDKVEIKKKIKQFTKTTNKFLKRISEKLEMPFPVTTYVARHSYATMAKNENISIAAISESLGHNSIKTTEIYLSELPEKERRKNADIIHSKFS